MRYILLTVSFFIVLSMTVPVRRHQTGDIYHFKKEKKYLPVCLSVNNDSGKEFYLYCSIYFKTKGIKIVSKQDAKDLGDQEFKSVVEPYLRNSSGANPPDFEETKRRMATDLSYVVNLLYIKIKFDSITNKVDSFMVRNFPLPLNLGNPYKSKWKSFDLSAIDTLPFANFAVAISDSIINANILLKEK